VNRSWDLIEKGGKSEDWTPAEEQRLQAITKQAHKIEYLIGLYHMNGHDPALGEKQGWEAGYNSARFRRRDCRWNACIGRRRLHLHPITTKKSRN
jgi:hypothetical protein